LIQREPRRGSGENAKKSITSASKLHRARHGTAVAVAGGQEVQTMNNIFYIIGVVVVIVAILGFLGLR
jgi:3-keto-L-gulonate-6-phosphate decarboxylase